MEIVQKIKDVWETITAIHSAWIAVYTQTWIALISMTRCG
jgi:hypothetical protein